MIINIIDYAASSTGAMISVVVLTPLFLLVAFLFLKLLFDLFKKKKEEDPEVAEKKKQLKEELRFNAILWQEEIESMKEEYGGKIPAEVLRQKHMMFNERHSVMQ